MSSLPQTPVQTIHNNTNNNELVYALRFKLLCESLNEEQFKKFIISITKSFPKKVMINILMSRFVTRSINIQIIETMIDKINDIKKNDISAAGANNFKKLDKLPKVIIQQISSFLSVLEFCKMSKLNCTIFVAMHSPSQLHELDVMYVFFCHYTHYTHFYTYIYIYIYSKFNTHCSIIDFNRFQLLIQNHINIKRLSIPAEILFSLNDFNKSKHSTSLKLKELQLNFQEDAKVHNSEAYNRILNDSLFIEYRNKMMNNLLKQSYISFSELISLTLYGDSGCIGLIVDLLKQCNHLRYLHVDSFGEDKKDAFIDLDLPHLQHLQIVCGGGFSLAKKFAQQVIKLVLHNIFFYGSIYQVETTNDHIQKMNFNKLIQLHFGGLYDKQIYSILKTCTNLKTLSLTNDQKYLMPEQNISKIISYIIINLQKLESIEIMYSGIDDSWEDVNSYFMVYAGIKQAFKKKKFDSNITITLNQVVSIKQIKEICKQIQRSVSKGTILLKFIGSMVFLYDDEKSQIKESEQIKNSITNMLAEEFNQKQHYNFNFISGEKYNIQFNIQFN